MYESFSRKRLLIIIDKKQKKVESLEAAVSHHNETTRALEASQRRERALQKKYDRLLIRYDKLKDSTRSSLK